jgi:outer membrane receptor protein involved in Fe transport
MFPMTRPFSLSIPALPLLCLLVCPSFAPAQSVRPPAGAGAAVEIPADETRVSPADIEKAGGTGIVHMSAFEVSTERDRGYRAAGTLAGTRLNTDLRDVAASVSVITKDMLDDLGTSDLGTLLNYTLGTEVSGLAGNFGNTIASGGFDDFDGITRSPIPSTSVRGLASADATRNYFLSDIPLDSYITERIDISRGPNSMLFGLGSPAGIINNGLIRANFNRNKTTLEVRFDNWGSSRGTLDTNIILIKRKLALRVAGLLNRQHFKQQPAFVLDRRAFVTATWRPFRDTTIKFNTEWANQDSNKPQNRPPFDSYTWWWDIGKPVYDPSVGRGELLGTPISDTMSGLIKNSSGNYQRNGNLLRAQIANWASNVGLIHENLGGSAFGITGFPSGIYGMEGYNERVRAPLSSTNYQSDGMSSMQNSQRYLQALHGGSSDPLYNFWKDFQITDPAVFDFYENLLEGRNKYEYADWHTHNLTVEHQFWDGRAGVELAGDWQYFDYGYNNAFQNRSYAIFIDINSKLPNGLDNPNYGRPVVADYGSVRSNSADRKAGRATAYLTLDARDISKGWLGKLLGKHTLTANYTAQERSAEAFSGRQTLLGLDHYYSEAATYNGNLDISASNSRRQLARVSYLGPSVLDAAGPANNGIHQMKADILAQDLTEIGVLYYQSPALGTSQMGTWEYRTFELLQSGRKDARELAAYTYQRTREKFFSTAFVLQSKWLQEHLVSTIGWRNDSYKTYDAGAAELDILTGLRITDSNVFYPKLGLDDSKDTFSYGIVGHLPNKLFQWVPGGLGLSLTYNRSDNFRPTAQRYSVYNTPYDPQKGHTEEYGIMLSLLDRRFELRATKYETTALNTTNGNLASVLNNIVREPRNMMQYIAAGYSNSRPEAIAAWNQWLATPEAIHFMDTFGYQKLVNPETGMESYVLDDRLGIVVSTSDVVSKGLEFELTFNPTANWRIAVNAAKQEVERTNTGKELAQLVESFRPAWTDPNGAGNLLRSNTDTTNTLGSYMQTQILNLRKELLLDGGTNPEVRKWRWNLVTNYRFSRGRLRGLNVGGAVRWQDKAALGYPVYIDDIAGPQYDVTRPHYGPRVTNYDMWVNYQRKIGKRLNWTIKLNIRNIGVQDKLIPVSTQPDGSIAAWRIAEPMTWSVTNTFSF